MLQIRTAEKNDHPAVRDFYYSLTDAMEDAEFRLSGWMSFPEIFPLKRSIPDLDFSTAAPSGCTTRTPAGPITGFLSFF